MREVDDINTNELGRIVQSFFRSSATRRGMVSTGEAIRLIRAELPDCSADDETLTELIARRAIWHGYDVSFDHERPAPKQGAA